MTADRIVHCKELREGDEVRRPVVGAAWLRVESIDRDARELAVRELESGERYAMQWDSASHWMRLAR